MSLEDQIRQLVVDEVRRQLAELRPAAPDDLMTTPEAAAYAHVCIGSVQRWVAQGKLTRRYAGRTLRISRRELDRLLRHGPERRALTPEEEADLDADHA